MTITYLIGGIEVPGVQTTWDRIVNRVNPDGSIVYSPWLNHTWKMASLEMPIWDALQTLEGNVVSLVQSNHIGSGNTQIFYNNVIVESLTGTARGNLMLNVQIQLSVNKSDTQWWRVRGMAATPLVVYQPKGAFTLTNSLINIIDPGVNDAIAGVLPTFDNATGWVFDGSTQFLDTQLAFLATFTMFVKFDVVFSVGSAKTLGGLVDTSNYLMFYFNPGALDALVFSYFTGTLQNVELVGTEHVATMFNRTFVQTLLDQTTGFTTTLFTGAPNTKPAYIGAGNDVAGATNFFEGSISAVAIYDGPMTSSQAKQVSANMAAL